MSRDAQGSLEYNLSEFARSFKERQKEREALEGTDSYLRFLDLAVDELISHYRQNIQEYFGREPKGTRQHPQMNKALSFIAAVKEVVFPQMWEQEYHNNKVENRMLESDMFALYYLLVQGEISKLYQSLCNTNPEIAELDRNAVEIKIAESFIQKWRKKNKEENLENIQAYISTTGFEYEYEDDIKMIAQIYEQLSLIVHHCEQAAKHGWEEIISNPNRYYKRNTLKSSLEVAELISLSQTFPDPNEALAFFIALLNPIKKLDELARSYNDAVGPTGNIDLYKIVDPDPEKESLAEAMITTKDYYLPELIPFAAIVPTKEKYLAEVGCYREKSERGQVREVAMKPSLSIIMQLREVLYLLKSDMLKGKLSIHQSVSGVEISRTNTRYTETIPILVAAGYFGSHDADIETEIYVAITDYGGLDYTEEQLREQILLVLQGKPEKAHPIVQNIVNYYVQQDNKPQCIKPFPGYAEDGNSMCYYANSYFYQKNEHNESYDVEPYPKKIDRLLEIRGYPTFNLNNPEEFNMFVRSSHFLWYAAIGEKATEKIEKGSRSDVDQRLSQAWLTLLSEWNKLVNEQQIYQPTNTERFYIGHSSNDIYDLVREKRTEYDFYINKIEISRNLEERHRKNEQQDTMQDRARKLIMIYQASIKAILESIQ